MNTGCSLGLRPRSRLMKSATIPVQHVKGQPAALTHVREKGCIKKDSNRVAPCIIYTWDGVHLRPLFEGNHVGAAAVLGFRITDWDWPIGAHRIRMCAARVEDKGGGGSGRSVRALAD